MTPLALSIQITISESDQQSEQVLPEQFWKIRHDSRDKIKITIAISHTFTPPTLRKSAERETQMMLCSAAIRRVTWGSRNLW